MLNFVGERILVEMLHSQVHQDESHEGHVTFLLLRKYSEPNVLHLQHPARLSEPESLPDDHSLPSTWSKYKIPFNDPFEANECSCDRDDEAPDGFRL